MKWILLLPLSLSLQAFYLNTNTSAAFDDNEVYVYITSNSSCSTNTTYSNDDILNAAVEGSKRLWNTVPTANIEVKKGGTYTTTDTTFINNKFEDIPGVTQIVIACNDDTTDNFTAANIYAISAPNNVSGSNLKGSIILVNNSAATTVDNLSRDELEIVMAHEIGHALGIGHSKNKAALMYYQNNDKRTRLAQDDIDAITYLYPNKLDGCTSIFGTIDTDSSNSKGGKGPFTFLISFLLGLCVVIFLSPLKKIK